MLKRIGYFFLALIAVVVSSLVIYKLSDEKLHPDSAEFFAKDAGLIKKITATENFFATVPKAKMDEIDISLCKKNSSVEEEKKAIVSINKYFETHTQLDEKATEFLSMEDVVFTDSSFVGMISQINKSRYLLKLVELKLCQLDKTGQKKDRKELLKKLIDRSLNVLENSSQLIADLIFSGQSEMALSELKSMGLAKAESDSLKKRISALNSQDIFQRSAKSDARTMMNQFTSSENLFERIKAEKNPILTVAEFSIEKAVHFNSIQNEMARRIKAQDFTVAGLKDGELQEGPIYSPQVYKETILVLYFSRMEDSKSRLDSKVQSLKSAVN